MIMPMKKLLTLCGLLMVCLFVSAQEPCPQVIPALQQWKGGRGKLEMPTEGNIVIRSTDEVALASTARILAEDLKEMFGWNYTVKTGKPTKQSIYLSISGPDETLGEEGYELTVKNHASIEAPTAKGAFWGTRTLLQMLYRQQGQLSKGTAIDYPLFPSRGFMLDVGRKFFTLDYLKQTIKVLSFYKMTEFQIHLNDTDSLSFTTMIGTRPMPPSAWRANASRV